MIDYVWELERHTAQKDEVRIAGADGQLKMWLRAILEKLPCRVLGCVDRVKRCFKCPTSL